MEHGVEPDASAARQCFMRAIFTPYNLHLIQCNCARDYGTSEPELRLTTSAVLGGAAPNREGRGGVLRIWEGWKSGKHWHASALEEIVAYLVAMVVGFSAATIAAAVVGLF
jgi:hypothetical protein